VPVTDIEGQGHPRTDNEVPEVELRHNHILSLTSALDGVGDQHHAPANLPPGRAGSHCIGGWVGNRAVLDGCGKSRAPPGLRYQNLNRERRL
jgi:hypothetical protein